MMHGKILFALTTFVVDVFYLFYNIIIILSIKTGRQRMEFYY